MSECIKTPRSPAQYLTDRLEEEIIFDRLHPRERLVEDELMMRFSAKRHVVREALIQLESMGLVERRRNVGAFVRSFCARQVMELYGVRALLEVEVVRQIQFPVDAEKLAELERIQQMHDTAVQACNAQEVFRINLLFHQKLFALSGNQTLMLAIEEFARQTYAIRFAGLTSDSYRRTAQLEHWQMIEALRTGNSTQLQHLCGQHLLPSRDAYLQTLQAKSG